MVLSAEGTSAPPQSPERMILQAAAFVQPCPSHDSGDVPPATCPCPAMRLTLPMACNPSVHPVGNRDRRTPPKP